MLEFNTCPCCHGYSDRPERTRDRLGRFYVGNGVRVCGDCEASCDPLGRCSFIFRGARA